MGIFVLVWGGLAVIGLGAMLDFELTPAVPAVARGEWPARSSLIRDPHRPTLLMFIHPHCPCSRASVAELSVLASECRGRASFQVLFVRPANCEVGWERTSLFATAQRIPGVIVACDAEGVEAARFGATTSGETLLFTGAGRLMFHGGITASRGHEGDNSGLAAVKTLIGAGRADAREAPIYGCSLLNLGEESQAQCNP
jgi:hypothetical protein